QQFRMLGTVHALGKLNSLLEHRNAFAVALLIAPYYAKIVERNSLVLPHLGAVPERSQRLVEPLFRFAIAADRQQGLGQSGLKNREPPFVLLAERGIDSYRFAKHVLSRVTLARQTHACREIAEHGRIVAGFLRIFLFQD